MRNHTLPAVLTLNGPPHSGKSWLAKTIVRLIPDAVIMQPNRFLYRSMQDSGAAPYKVEYEDFKKLLGSRDRLIEYSMKKRQVDPEIWERQLVSSELYCMSRVVIIDNVGHTPTEHEFYESHAKQALLLRVDTPFNEIEPMKSYARRRQTLWEGDSRMPLTSHTMLTAYDSHQMALLLDWLHKCQSPEEAGPYYGIQTIWNQYFKAREPTASARLGFGSSGQLGGLGHAAQSDRITV